MKDSSKTNQELIAEISVLKKRIQELENSEAERKRVEEALRERNKELNCLYGISALMELPGLSLDEILKRTVMLIPPAWQFPEITEASIVLEGKIFQTARFRETSWMQTREVIVNGMPVGQVEVCYLEEQQASDEGPFLKEERKLLNAIAERFGRITDRKQAEEKLRESEELFRGYLECAPDGVCVSDLEGNLLYGNLMCEEIIGYRSEELIGKKFLELNILPGKSLNKAVQMLQENMEGRPTGPIEIDLISKEGRLIPVEINTNVVQRMGQGIVLSFIRDITKRKRAEEELKRTLESLRKAFGTIIQVMGSAVETRDPYTAGHQIRSADLGSAIATEMGLPQEKIEGIRMAGSIHDIGKLSVPAEILSKPTKLSDIEFRLIKEHAQHGYVMLKDVESPWPLAEIVCQHHERMDGSGYPRNLKGDDILMEARIMAVADVVEAMASHRPYRPGLGIDAALNEIGKNRVTLYDNAVADACLRLFREKGYQLEGAWTSNGNAHLNSTSSLIDS
jgi:PAS domain S-box-containing protein